MASSGTLVGRTQLGRCLVTGAAGFLGTRLVAKLLDEGHEVRALIRSTPLEIRHPNLEIVTGSIEDADRIVECCEGINTVFHTAARLALLGGRGVTKAYRDAAHSTNVHGTNNIIAACTKHGVNRLVYTSSIDVCFNGVEDLNMGEHTPYASTFHSLYTETKVQAEQAVLAANGVNDLLTTSLRPAGIYGEGNNVMMDSMFEQVTKGRLVATVGGAGAVTEHVYVDNLVHAELLSARALVAQSPVPGNAYFITDGHRAALFEFLRPLIESLGHKIPNANIPYKPVLRMAELWQYMHFKFGLPEPTLCPHEIRKLGISHSGSNTEARRDFGYEPLVSPDAAMERCIKHYQSLLSS